MFTPDSRKELAQMCSSIIWDADMGKYTTFRTGGRVDALVTIEQEEELGKLVAFFQKREIPWHIVGSGSNILVASSQVHAVFLRLMGDFSAVSFVQDSVDEETRLISAGAGCSLSRLSAFCQQHECAGLEWMIGIPGTVGGAIRMNAGAHGKNVAGSVQWVVVMDVSGRVTTLDVNDIKFGYRSTRFPGDNQGMTGILKGVFAVQRGKRGEIQQQCHEYSRFRKKRQPVTAASAGSFFKNPEGDAAGRLIEQAGLKGYQVGGAMISSLHGNFVINTGSATPQDILSLMEQVQKKIRNQFGVKLEPEVKIF